MDADLHLNKQMDEAESFPDRWKEDALLNMLTETIRGLEAVRRRRGCHKGTNKPGGGRGEEMQRGSKEGPLSSGDGEEEDEERGGNADEEREEKGSMQRVLGVLRELSVFHSDRVTAWREVLRGCAHMVATSPPGGSDQQHPPPTGV